MNKFFVLCFCAAALFGAAQSLQFEDYQEGSCLEFKPQSNFNTTWLANTNLPYVNAGSRYHLYRMASAHPQFANMREFEFNYESCLQTYLNTTTGIGLAYGFGVGVIGNFDVRYTDKKGVFEMVPLPNPALEDIVRHTVTLTDNKNFVVFSNCWTGSNQRSWSVISRTPTLDAKTQTLIEDHIKSLGFDRKNSVFLRYNTCSANGPVPGSNSNGRTLGGKTSSAGLYASRMMRRGSMINRP